MKTMKSLVAAAAFLALCGSANAALHARDGGMVYDDVNNITWLADMNYAQTQMAWDTAKAWAESLSYGGFSDWRLPTLNSADVTCSDSWNPGGGLGLQHSGFNCTGGELSHLFAVDLGQKANQPIWDKSGDSTVQMVNLALFKHVHDGIFWSGTEYAPNPYFAWQLAGYNGTQGLSGKQALQYAMAVRPGDVSAVPEPGAYALLLAGVGVVCAAVRRRPI